MAHIAKESKDVHHGQSVLRETVTLVLVEKCDCATLSPAPLSLRNAICTRIASLSPVLSLYSSSVPIDEAPLEVVRSALCCHLYSQCVPGKEYTRAICRPPQRRATCASSRKRDDEIFEAIYAR